MIRMSENNTESGKTTLPLSWIVVAVVVLGGLYLLSQTLAPTSDAVVLQSETASTTLLPPSPPGTNEALKTQLSKANYLKEIFKVDRDTYDLFELAAQHRDESVEQVKQFFYNCCGLVNEEDIFAKLPPLPADFPEVAYDLQVGRLYQIGLLGPEYYKQPEFYFNGSETSSVNKRFAFKAWSEPDLQYWGDYGMLTYPNVQHDTLQTNGRTEFTSTVFVTNGWNIQNYVGVHLIPSSFSQQYFDIEISEESTGQPYFLLEPTFPYYFENWATKVVITGKLKEGTPPGTYYIGINPVTPPKELNEKWNNEHTGLYAPYGFLTPSGNYIDLVITVE